MFRFLSTVATLSLMAGAAHADYTLNVLHINDLHSRLEPVSKYDSTCSAESDAEGKCFGGVARVATKINELRSGIQAQGGNVIVLDAGDQFQGSMMYTTYKGAAAAELMEGIGFDAMAVGNHEFDDGPSKLRTFTDAVSFPVVSGNIDVSGEPALNGHVDKYTILEVGGQKVGIVSALATDTVDTSSPGDNVVFNDEIESLKADVAALQGQGVDIIIALTHVGLAKDLDIAANVPGIDAVVGGHSHTLLSASSPKRAGAYPTFVSQEDGTLVPVTQAYAYSKYVGHLELTFDDDGNLLYAGGDTILLDASVTPDAAIAARVAELGGPIEELKAKVVASTAAAIDGERGNCRTGECQMGNLVADAMLDRVKDQGVTIAIQNGGGLRASIDAGEVTMGEVLTVLPFQNTLATFEISGQGVIDALENGVSQVEEVKGRFPQVAGLKFTWDASVPAGEGRVQEVMVADGDGFVPIDPAKVYKVVTNNYMRSGGDGYKMFRGGMNAYDYGPGLEVVVADFLAASGPYTPYTDGRIAQK
ncbi:MAG: bifunctional metallophosphatase/5'-nucleotidase [Planktomarina sp.]